MGAKLERAVEEIELEDSVPIMNAFGNVKPANKRRGSPAKTQAHFVAREVGNIFADLAGKEPTIITDPHSFGNVARGPFIDLLEGVFGIVTIDASAETWARRVCKERNSSRG